MISVEVSSIEFYNAAITMLEEHGITGEYEYVNHATYGGCLLLKSPMSTNVSDDTIGAQVLKLIGVMSWPVSTETTPESNQENTTTPVIALVKPTITVPTQAAEIVTGENSSEQSSV